MSSRPACLVQQQYGQSNLAPVMLACDLLCEDAGHALNMWVTSGATVFILAHPVLAFDNVVDRT